MRSPLLFLHIIAGTVGMVFGFVTVFLRKGSRRHRIAGDVFVTAMLTLGASAVYLAVMKHQTGNILGGLLTFYLVATAWMTARRREEQTGIFDWAGLLVAIAVGAAMMIYGLEKVYGRPGFKDGVPAGMNFFMGSVVLLAATGDVRMLVRGGISGTQRLARHLWRMCFAWFIAAGSIFLARPHLFPVFMRKTGMLVFLSFMPLLSMVFWLIRVRVAKAYKRKSMPSRSAVYALPAQPSTTVSRKAQSSSAS
jgi:hypothetical protein